MKGIAQLGVSCSAAAARWEVFGHFVFRVPVGLTVSLSWFSLALLACLPVAGGAYLGYLAAKAKRRKDLGASTVGELEMLRAVVASLPDLIYVKDAESRFLLANQGLAEVMGGGTSADLIGKTDFDFFPPELASGFYKDEQRILQTGQRLVSQEEHINERDGRPRWILTTKVPLHDGAGQRIGIIGIGRNITALKDVEAELERARDQLEFKAAHDSLTSLLNREAISEMLTRELARNARENTCTAVLLGDLDHFKLINDEHGHPIGDEVLREVARRLLATVRPYDLVGRYGGEEFLLVLPNCCGQEALARANQLRDAVAASPVSTRQGPVPMTISIGVLVTERSENPTYAEVLRQVDIALYEAKAAGRNRCAYTSPTLSALANN